MGRQAHLTRLALGRSPYGPPLHDDNGDLLLGPHTHDDDARQYVQQFDRRGHPTNKETDVQNRRLRRAQNEVLKLAGVVRSTHDTPKPDPWKTMRDDEKKDLITEENELIRYTRLFDHTLLDVTTSWVYALRFRIMTYRSYLGPPVISMLRSERRIVGWRETLFSALPLSIVTHISRRWRSFLYAKPYYRCSLLTVRSKYQHISGTRFEKLSRHLWELLLFAVEWPFATAASLQMLHLLPSTIILSPRTIYSILAITMFEEAPTLPRSISLAEISQFCMGVLRHPFVIAYLMDQVRESLETGIRAILRFQLPVPDEPDILSERHMPEWFEHDYIRAQIPGCGYDVDAIRTYRGPKNFSEAMRMAFPFISKALYSLTGFPAVLRPHLNQDNEVQLQSLIELRYGDLWRENRHFTEVLRLPDRTIRERAVVDALSRVGIDPVHDGISIGVWAMRIPDRSHDGSTTTPDPRDLFSNAEGDEGMLLTNQESHVGDDNIVESALSIPSPDEPRTTDSTTIDNVSHTSGQEVGRTNESEGDQFQATVPLERLLLPVGEPEFSPVERTTTTPSPGITRAPSLDQALPRPVRRPTEVDVDFDGEIFSQPNRPIRSGSLTEEIPEDPVHPVRHRVTLLSNLPTEIAALHGSKLLTSILMLPYDIYYHRMLAQRFLGSQRLLNRTGGLLLDDVAPLPSYPTSPSQGIYSWYTLAKNLAITFGMQAGISTLIWKAVQWSVLNLGREYGWGKI